MDTLSPGTHTFTVDGVRQVYHVAGAGPVLVAHAGGPGLDWSYLRSADLEHHFTMVYPEPAGTGESGPLPAGATYVGTYVTMLSALIDHLGLPDVHLLGHSHGGFVALRYALDHPDRVAGLALYSTSPVGDGEFWAAMAASAAAYPQRHPDVPEAAEAPGWMTAPGNTHEERTAAIRGMLPLYFADYWGRRAEYADVRAHMRAWPVALADGHFDYRAELSRITARTVVVCGRHDFICGPVWGEMLHRGIAGSRMVMLENSGHFAHLEEPNAYAEAVTWLLAPE